MDTQLQLENTEMKFASLKEDLSYVGKDFANMKDALHKNIGNHWLIAFNRISIEKHCIKLTEST